MLVRLMRERSRTTSWQLISAIPQEDKPHLRATEAALYCAPPIGLQSALLGVFFFTTI